VHTYIDSPEVIYVGNGYLGLHAVNGGRKSIKLPAAAKVTAIFGADFAEQTTDTIEFELGENGTALFRLN